MNCSCRRNRIVIDEKSSTELEIADSIESLAQKIIAEGKQLSDIADRIRKGAPKP